MPDYSFPYDTAGSIQTRNGQLVLAFSPVHWGTERYDHIPLEPHHQSFHEGQSVHARIAGDKDRNVLVIHRIFPE